MSDLVETFFPFYKFGLTRNPFGTLSPAEQVAVTVPPPEIEAALQTGFVHLVVLGRKGRGKSTALRYVQWHFMAAGQRTGYERIPRWQWRYTTDIAPLDVFALDEAQRLAPWEVWRLFSERGDRRLLIGSHRGMALDFWARGLDVLTVRLDGAMTRARLAAILARRLGAFALDDAPPKLHFAPDAVDYLWRRFGDDLRSMNFYLYDVFQRLDAPGAVTRERLTGAAQTNGSQSYPASSQYQS
jgi:hypothetical protein